MVRKRERIKMSKWCFNYDSDEYEYIDQDGFSINRGDFVYNWDDSEYRRDEEEEKLRNTGHSAVMKTNK